MIVGETAVVLLGWSNLVLARAVVRKHGSGGNRQRPSAAGRAGSGVPDGTMSRDDAAVLLGISHRQVRRLGRDGVLENVPQPGRQTLVTASSVHACLAGRGSSEAGSD